MERAAHVHPRPRREAGGQAPAETPTADHYSPRHKLPCTLVKQPRKSTMRMHTDCLNHARTKYAV